MAEYQERATRIPVHLPVEFYNENIEVTGSCLNISRSGLWGSFAQPLDLWTNGKLVLDFAHRFLDIRARVVRADGQNAGLIFIFETNTDRLALNRAVWLAQYELRAHGHSGEFPF